MNSLGISNRGAINPVALAAAIVALTESPHVDPRSERLSDVTYTFSVQDIVTGPHGIGIVSGYNHNGEFTTATVIPTVFCLKTVITMSILPMIWRGLDNFQ